MAFIGATVALLIGILIFSEISEAIDCDGVSGFGNNDLAIQCENTKSTLWLVIAILPIALFFAMFSIFGGIGGYDDEDDKKIARTYTTNTETKKQRQKRKQKAVDDQLAKYDDHVVHSFLSNWFRGKKD